MCRKHFWAATLLVGLSIAGCEKEKEPETESSDDATTEAVDKKDQKAEENRQEGENDESQKEADRQADQAAPLAAFDRDRELEAVAGTWTVTLKPGGTGDVTWEIDGHDLTRKEGDAKSELDLHISYPGRLAVIDGNQTRYYAYARSPETGKFYVGLGEGGVKLGDRYYVAGNDGLVVFDGSNCQYHPDDEKFGWKPDFREPADIACRIEERDDKTFFHYQMPKRGEDDTFRDERVRVVDGALVNRQLRVSHAAEPADETD